MADNWELMGSGLLEGTQGGCIRTLEMERTGFQGLRLRPGLRFTVFVFNVLGKLLLKQ